MKKNKYPEDWDILQLKKIAHLNQDTLPESTSPDYLFKYIDLGSVKNGRISDENGFVSFANSSPRARRILHENNIIMSTVRPNLAGFAIADFDVKNTICSTGFALIEPKNEKDLQYIYQNLFSSFLQRQYFSIVVGSNYPALNNSDVQHLLFPFPKNEKEREKIGHILNSCDLYINGIENLISQKLLLKKGLMQKLLSGKKRFKEFEKSKWVIKHLSDFFSEFSEKNSLNANYPILTCSKVFGILLQEDRFGRRVASSDVRRYKIVRKGTLVYDPMLLWDASINFVKNFNIGLISPAYFTFSFNEKEGAQLFFEYLFDSHFLRHQYKVISRGTNVRRKKAPAEDFLSMKIKIPSLIDEQQKIASTLLSIDIEIDLLRTKLKLLKQQKKGLMQKLLTGKIRVKV